MRKRILFSQALVQLAAAGRLKNSYPPPPPPPPAVAAVEVQPVSEVPVLSLPAFIVPQRDNPTQVVINFPKEHLLGELASLAGQFLGHAPHLIDPISSEIGTIRPPMPPSPSIHDVEGYIVPNSHFPHSEAITTLTSGGRLQPGKLHIEPNTMPSAGPQINLAAMPAPTGPPPMKFAPPPVPRTELRSKRSSKVEDKVTDEKVRQRNRQALASLRSANKQR